jgi:CRP-like cAMP-binding protein
MPTDSFPAFATRENGPIRDFPLPLGYPAGVNLCRQGEDAQEVFHVEKGLVKLLRLLPSGEERIVGLRSAGWFVAAAAAILEEPLVATAVTVTDARIARLSAACFRRLLHGNSELSWRIHRMHSLEVYTGLIQIANLSAMEARERLERLLQGLAQCEERRNGETRFVVPLRQWEMAQLLGITPPYLCQLLKELQEEGVLRREGQSWVVTYDRTLDPSAGPK